MIVDASVVVKWFVLEDQHDDARALLLTDDPLVAPDLLAIEVTNVLWVKVRRGELDAAQAARAIAAVSGQGEPQLRKSTTLLPAALDLAIVLEHPVYDCLYVALAREVGDVLCTADRGLARVVRHHDAARVILLGEEPTLS